MINKRELIENFKFRVGLAYPEACPIRCGCGCSNPDLVVVQNNMERHALDTVRFVLNHMGLYRCTFVAPLSFVSGADPNVNAYYLRELVDLLSPLVVISVDDHTLCILKKLNQQTQLSRHRGRVFFSDVLRREVFGTSHPQVYSHASGNKRIKDIARMHWESIKQVIIERKITTIMEQWDCDEPEAKRLVMREFSASA
jgi:hypothetical protein